MNEQLFYNSGLGSIENEISDYLWLEKSAAIRRLGGRSIGRILESADTFLRTRILRTTKK